jgi:5-methylcytosine-specific restriction endonuclease McrA
MNGNCVLLNGDYTFLGLVDWKKAMGLMLAEKVRVLKFSDRVIQGVSRTFRAPAVAVLVKVVRSIYRGRVPFSRRNLLARDRFACAYCGSRSRPITMDHVIPRSRGGKTDFDNCVACCRACNLKKGALLPREAGMVLRRRPWQPTIAEFIRIRLRDSGVYELLVELGLMG